MNTKLYLISGAILLSLSGCMVSSKQMIVENTQQLELRSYQIKTYNHNKKTLAKASIAALQDLGFIIDSADLDVGAISATKFAKNSSMQMTITIRQSSNSQTQVRANAQFGGTAVKQAVEDPATYSAFFNVLDKAIFFETQGI
ncbi:hypothetical protein [Helicobacter pullorum]|uniref:hypothetical protein n=1 Tax=Helicobacter pullorum TaxID=35818 RepID=UPI0032095261